MSCQFHHPGQILVLIVAAKEFQFTVTTYQQKRRTILSHPVEGSIFIDGGLQRTESLHLTYIIMCDGLSAKGSIEHHGVGVYAIVSEPCLVQAKQHCQIAASRMACNHNLLRVTTVLPYIAEHPCHGFSCIIDRFLDGHFGQQAVVGTHYDITFIFQSFRYFLITCFQSTAVEPNHDRTIFLILRIVDI